MRRQMVLGAAALAVSVAYFALARQISQTQLADAIGPQGLPRIYAFILAALSLILMVQAARRAPDTALAEAKAPSGIRRAAGMIAIGAAYLLLAPWLGYLLSVAGLILATTYYQGGTWTRQVALVAICGGVFFWLLFVVLMGIQQPPGFWRLLL